MGKEPGLSNLTCLGVFVGCLRGFGAQAATFTVNTSVDIADANPGDGACDIAPPTTSAHCGPLFNVTHQ